MAGKFLLDVILRMSRFLLSQCRLLPKHSSCMYAFSYGLLLPFSGKQQAKYEKDDSSKRQTKN